MSDAPLSTTLWCIFTSGHGRDQPQNLCMLDYSIKQAINVDCKHTCILLSSVYFQFPVEFWKNHKIHGATREPLEMVISKTPLLPRPKVSTRLCQSIFEYLKRKGINSSNFVYTVVIPKLPAMLLLLLNSVLHLFTAFNNFFGISIFNACNVTPLRNDLDSPYSSGTTTSSGIFPFIWTFSRTNI